MHHSKTLLNVGARVQYAPKKRLHNFHDIRECQVNGGCTDYTCRYYFLQGIGPSAYQKNMWLGTMLKYKHYG